MWFRRDLRLSDNQTLRRALDECDQVVPLFIVDEVLWATASPNRRWFLAGSLADLDRQIDGRLVIRRGEAPSVVSRLVREHGIGWVYRAEESAPYGRRRDADVDDAVRACGARTVVVDHPTVAPLGSVRTGNGEPFKVFTPYFRQWQSTSPGESIHRPATVPTVEGVSSHGLPDGGEPTANAWRPEPGETAARIALDRYLRSGMEHYADERDIPAADRTSRLGAYLKFGCLHPRQILGRLDPTNPSHALFTKQLAWRDFYADVIRAWPESAWSSWNPKLAGIELDTGDDADGRFEAWCAGRTGYPLVDAGMRQLVAEGYMHNRLRMVVASFLVKDLHLDWTRGARFFLDHLFDGDLASNNHGWQWAAGTGTDAAPYFRIFNPTRQSERFDPDGAYVRRWVPELADVGPAELHAVSEASDGLAAEYPLPIVDHAAERDEALRRLAVVSGARR